MKILSLYPIIFACLLLPGVLVQGAEGNAEELRVATYNIRYGRNQIFGVRTWPSRRRAVIETLRELELDVLGVQEALSNQMEDLSKAFPVFDFVGVGRDDGKQAGEFSAIFFDKERFEPDLREQGSFWLSDKPEEPGSKTWGNEVVRICSWVRLVDKDTGKGFYVFNTHWDHRHQGSREKSARLIGQRVLGRKHGDEPVILMGDFNAGLGNPALGYLLGRNQGLRPAFLSAYLKVNPGQPEWQTFNNWQRGKRRGVMIDHLLLSSGWSVKACRVIFPIDDGHPPSDHFPVMAELTMQ